MNATRCASVLLILLLASTGAVAQMTTGSVVGTVTSEGAPLPGVTVTASSPALQGVRTTVSGEGGGFSFPNLPPGSYRLTYELAGMEKMEKRVTVSVSQTSRADTEMRVAAVAEQITVTAEAPVAAMTDEIAANFESEQINQLPVDRTIDSVVRLSPGVTEAGPNNQITISGATSFDNLFLVNGVVVNENLRGQPTPLYIEDAVQETTVLSGGISAEFGRFTGGVVSTITKSGGNEFSGSIRDSLTNPSWSDKTDFAAQVEPLDEINSVYEATLGGRILTDRLWFFTSGRTQSTEQSRQTTQTNIPFTSTTDDNRYEIKLTGQVTPRHSLVGSYTNSHNEIDKSVSSGSVVDLRSLTPYDRPRSLMSINYNGVLSDQVLIEGQYSRMNDKFTNGANERDIINGTLLMDVSTRRRMWSPTFCGAPCPPKERDNKSFLLKSSYFLSTASMGNHSIVGGAEEFHQLRNENNYQSGSDFRIHGRFIQVGDQMFFGTDPDAGEIEWDPVPALSQTSDFAVRSFFLNDKWDLGSHWGFNVGVRYDSAFGDDQAGNKTVDDQAFSPRLAASYDLRGDGRHRFSTSYGRYVSKVDQGPADNTAAAGRYASYYWDYRGPLINAPGTPPNELVATEEVIRRVFEWFESVGGVRNKDYLNSAWLPGASSRFERSLQAPFMDEIRAGYAYTFGGRNFVRADYIMREWADFYVIRRTIETGKSTDPNGDQFDQGVIENSDEGLSREYDGIQLQASYTPYNPLTIGLNYTYSTLEGNLEGETASFATSITANPSYPEYTAFYENNPMGYLGADMRHRGNLWIAYDVETPFGMLNLSLFERYHSALSYSAVGSIDVRKGASNGPPDGVVNPGYETPPSSVTYFFGERGDYRVDAVTATDLGLNFYLPPMGGVTIFVEADLLNMFNQQAIEDPDYIDKTILTRRNSNCLQTGTTTRCVAFNPFNEQPVEGKHWQKGSAFGTPTSQFAYQSPRTYRFSLGVRF
jgi:hypothetical protein